MHRADENEAKLFFAKYSQQDLPGLIKFKGQVMVAQMTSEGLVLREREEADKDLKILKTKEKKAQEQKKKNLKIRVGAGLAALGIAGGVGAGMLTKKANDSHNEDNAVVEIVEKNQENKENGTTLVTMQDGSVEARLSSGVAEIRDVKAYQNDNGWFMYLSSLLDVSKDTTSYVNGLFEKYNEQHKTDGKAINYVEIPELLVASIIDVESSAQIADPTKPYTTNSEENQKCVGPTGIGPMAIQDAKTNEIISKLKSVGLDEDLIINKTGNGDKDYDYAQRNDIFTSCLYTVIILEAVNPEYLHSVDQEKLISSYNYGIGNVNKNSYNKGYYEAVKNVYGAIAEAAKGDKPASYYWAKMNEARNGVEKIINQRSIEIGGQR